MFSSKTIFFALLLALFLVGNNANSEDLAHNGVVPLNKIPSEQWIEKVWGDSDKPGLPFVIRIHNDAGYVVLPHTHPEDENIAIVQGSWSLGMGRRFSRSELEPMELGAFGFVPKKMAHFAYAKIETILQVHGIGPFENNVIDPLYQLTDKGVLLKPSLVKPGVHTIQPTGLLRAEDWRACAWRGRRRHRRRRVVLACESGHSVLDPKTEQRAILGHASGIETTVSRLPQDSRQEGT